MRAEYQAWLEHRGYNRNTVSAQLYRAGRVEECYGDLDQHFEADRLEAVIAAFVYTAEDARQSRPNPTHIPFDGAIPGNMNSYKFAVRLYRDYRQEMAQSSGQEIEPDELAPPRLPPPPKRLVLPLKSNPKPVENPTTLEHFGLDGFAALKSLIASSIYKSPEQAIASLALFSHPETVRQTSGKAIFRTIRGLNARGTYQEVDGQLVMLDDNKSASDAFKWVHGITGRLKDIQFNHIYTASKDVTAYTSLANICMTPAFLAKLTDGSGSATSSLLKYRVYDLYGWMPSGLSAPKKPECYGDLDWAPTLPPVTDVKGSLEARMASKSKDRTVLSINKVGWLFGDGCASQTS